MVRMGAKGDKMAKSWRTAGRNKYRVFGNKKTGGYLDMGVISADNVESARKKIARHFPAGGNYRVVVEK